jgi:rhodanese-related sulfurtransferase
MPFRRDKERELPESNTSYVRITYSPLPSLKILNMKHLFSLTFLAISFLFFTSCSGNAQVGYKDLASAQYNKILKDQQAVVIDVRTPGEVGEGYIPEASIFIDYNSGSFEQQIKKLDKNKTYIVYCRSGGRSAGASTIMVNNGFKNIYNLQGGMMQWRGPVKRP